MGDFSGGRVFSINRLAEMCVLVGANANPRLPHNPYIFIASQIDSPRLKTLQNRWHPGPETVHLYLVVELPDASDDLIEVVTATEGHRDDHRPGRDRMKELRAGYHRFPPQVNVLKIVGPCPAQVNPSGETHEDGPDPLRVVYDASG